MSHNGIQSLALSQESHLFSEILSTMTPLSIYFSFIIFSISKMTLHQQALHQLLRPHFSVNHPTKACSQVLS